jgi:hypothetical protein
MSACAIALVLLMDVSGSVDEVRYRLQQQGLAESLLEPQLAQVVQSLPEPMAITVIEWAESPSTMVPWVMVHASADLLNLAHQVSNHSRNTTSGFNTAVGRALEAGMEAFASEPCVPERRVIDISGDGENNNGPSPQSIRLKAEANSITINALPIVSNNYPSLDDWFRQNVVTSDGFVIVAEGFADIGRALRRKLVMEIAQTGSTP